MAEIAGQTTPLGRIVGLRWTSHVTICSFVRVKQRLVVTGPNLRTLAVRKAHECEPPTRAWRNPLCIWVLSGHKP